MFHDFQLHTSRPVAIGRHGMSAIVESRHCLDCPRTIDAILAIVVLGRDKPAVTTGFRKQ
jgi:hypothetical protein